MMKKHYERWSTLLLVLCVGFFAWKLFFGPLLMNGASKEALAAMQEEIAPGDSGDEVVAIYERLKTGRTFLKRDVYADTWGAGMPEEYGGGDWVLFVQFGGDNRVSAVAMRASEGISERPEGAPADEGEFHAPRSR